MHSYVNLDIHVLRVIGGWAVTGDCGSIAILQSRLAYMARHLRIIQTSLLVYVILGKMVLYLCLYFRMYVWRVHALFNHHGINQSKTGMTPMTNDISNFSKVL